MKKMLSTLVAICLVFSMAACGGGGTTASQAGDGSTAAAGGSENTGGSGKKTVVKISMTEGLNSSTYARAVEFGEKVNAACGDAFDFQLYPNDQLGSYHDVTMEAINGSVEMIIGGLSTNLDPRGSIAYTPYLCTSLERVDYYYGKGSFIYDLVTDIADGMGLVFLGFDISGMEGMAVRGDLPADPLKPGTDKGPQIRTTGSEMPRTLMSELGYTPVTVEWNEVYSSTQSGLVNGFLGANAGSAYNQFRDIIDYYLPIGFAVDSNRIVMSGVFWEKLTAEQQEAFSKYAAEMFTESIEKTKSEEADYLSKMAESGVNVVDLSEEDYEALAQLAREKCWPVIADTYGEEVYNQMMEFYSE